MVPIHLARPCWFLLAASAWGCVAVILAPRFSPSPRRSLLKPESQPFLGAGLGRLFDPLYNAVDLEPEAVIDYCREE
jgi:hypothetical protein